jgi:hypothetical protein
MISRFVLPALWIALVTVICAAPAYAIVGGQIDNFEDGTLQNWQAGGFSNPNGPVNVATGGPAGLNDNFMRLTSNGGSAGGKLVVFNSNQWSGNYNAANVGSLQLQVNNLGNTNLVLRLILENAVAGQSLGTLTGVSVPAGSGWMNVSFPLNAANLSGGTLSTVLSNVTNLNLVHAPSFVLARTSSPSIVAQLGVDNIRAVVVPEPGTLAMAAVMSLVTIGFAARRRPAPIGD